VEKLRELPGILAENQDLIALHCVRYSLFTQ
jgi:hypothetical protein